MMHTIKVEVEIVTDGDKCSRGCQFLNSEYHECDLYRSLLTCVGGLPAKFIRCKKCKQATGDE